jgi:hypothetical protein
MGTRAWLTKILDEDVIPALGKLKNTPKGRERATDLLEAFRQDWDYRGFTTLQKQQSLMDISRRAIKDALGLNHFSLNILKFTTEQYFELNRSKQKRADTRNQWQAVLENPDAIVAKAVQLLESKSWAEVAAGLAIVTGRRSSEILATAQFTEVSRWSVQFSGALKRRGEAVPLQFEIPTLTTAARVCKAIAYIRSQIDITDLNNDQVSAKYGTAVAKASDRHFLDLIPCPEGRDTLYTHLWRSVYSCIATFWYCPPSVWDVAFKAEILGHFAALGEGDRSEDRLRSLASEKHYAVYEISDTTIAQYNGRRKGIKLGVGGVQPIATFRGAWTKQRKAQGIDPDLAPDLATHNPESEPDPEALLTTALQDFNPSTAYPTQRRRVTSTLRIWQDDRDRLTAIIERFSVSDDPRQQNRIAALLDWLEQVDPDHRPNRIPEQSSTREDIPKAEISTSTSPQHRFTHQPIQLNLVDSIEAIATTQTPTKTPIQTPVAPVVSPAPQAVPEQSLSTTSIAPPEIPQVIPSEIPPEIPPVVPQVIPYSIQQQPIQQQPPSPLDPSVVAMIQAVGGLTQQLSLLLSSGHLTAVAPATPQPAIPQPAIPQTTPQPQSPPSNSANISPADDTAVPLRRGRKPKAEISETINNAIDAIMAWNDSPGRRHDEKWLITINNLKQFCSAQPRILQILSDRQAELKAHARKHGLEPQHNLRHRGKRTITEVIQQSQTDVSD